MLRAPLNAQIDLTDSCNQFCNYCYNFWNYLPQSKKSILPEEAKYVAYLCSRYKIFKMEDIINKEGNSQEEQDNIRNFISRIYDSGFLYLS